MMKYLIFLSDDPAAGPRKFHPETSFSAPLTEMRLLTSYLTES
jgi:hypothetical protein